MTLHVPLLIIFRVKYYGINILDANASDIVHSAFYPIRRWLVSTKIPKVRRSSSRTWAPRTLE